MGSGALEEYSRVMFLGCVGCAALSDKYSGSRTATGSANDAFDIIVGIAGPDGVDSMGIIVLNMFIYGG